MKLTPGSVDWTVLLSGRFKATLVVPLAEKVTEVRVESTGTL